MAENTPTQEAIAKATQTFEIEDAERKVKITLRRPSVLMQYRLIELLGGERSSNPTYVVMVLPLIYVSAIDGIAVPPLTKHSEVEALIQRLDESGIAAVAEGVDKHFGKTKTPAETADKVKK